MIRRTTPGRARVARAPSGEVQPRAKAIARPGGPPGHLTWDPNARTTAENVARFREIGRNEEIGRYDKALILKAESRPERYRAANYPSFEAFVKANGLPSRMSTFKWFKVIAQLSKEQMLEIGGMEKAYQAIMALEAEKPGTHPRTLLKPGAMILGRAVGSVSSRWLERARGQLGMAPQVGLVSNRASAETKLAAQRMRRSLERLKIVATLRAQLNERDESVVKIEVATKPAVRLAALLKHAQKSGFT